LLVVINTLVIKSLLQKGTEKRSIFYYLISYKK
jgi:hypothetical protein